MLFEKSNIYKLSLESNSGITGKNINRHVLKVLTMINDLHSYNFYNAKAFTPIIAYITSFSCSFSKY